MKRLIVLAALTLFIAPTRCKASGLTFGDDTGCIVISTTPARPTQILTADPNAVRTYILNDSSFRLHVSTKSANLSTSTVNGDFYLLANSNWTPDGQNDAFQGALYAVTGGTTTVQSACRQRTR